MTEKKNARTIAIDVDNTIADYTDGLRHWMLNHIDKTMLGPMPEPDFYDFELATGWMFPDNEFLPVHQAAVEDGLYLNNRRRNGSPDRTSTTIGSHPTRTRPPPSILTTIRTCSSVERSSNPTASPWPSNTNTTSSGRG